MRRKVSGGNTFGDHRNKGLAGFRLETVMEPSKAGIALGTVDKGGDAGGKDRLAGNQGDVLHDPFQPLAR